MAIHVTKFHSVHTQWLQMAHKFMETMVKSLIRELHLKFELSSSREIIILSFGRLEQLLAKVGKKLCKKKIVAVILTPWQKKLKVECP